MRYLIASDSISPLKIFLCLRIFLPTLVYPSIIPHPVVKSCLHLGERSSHDYIGSASRTYSDWLLLFPEVWNLKSRAVFSLILSPRPPITSIARSTGLELLPYYCHILFSSQRLLQSLRNRRDCVPQTDDLFPIAGSPHF